jgi:hypothetical protein
MCILCCSFTYRTGASCFIIIIPLLCVIPMCDAVNNTQVCMITCFHGYRQIAAHHCLIYRYCFLRDVRDWLAWLPSFGGTTREHSGGSSCDRHVITYCYKIIIMFYFKSTFLYIWNVIYFSFQHHTWAHCAVVQSHHLRNTFNDDFTMYEICEGNVLES